MSRHSQLKLRKYISILRDWQIVQIVLRQAVKVRLIIFILL